MERLITADASKVSGLDFFYAVTGTTPPTEAERAERAAKAAEARRLDDERHEREMAELAERIEQAKVRAREGRERFNASLRADYVRMSIETDEDAGTGRIAA